VTVRYVFDSQTVSLDGYSTHLFIFERVWHVLERDVRSALTLNGDRTYLRRLESLWYVFDGKPCIGYSGLAHLGRPEMIGYVLQSAAV
jgi:hypothetical protein